MKNKFLKEKKLKNKFLAVSMASIILMSSFPVTNPVHALANEVLDGVTQATENDSNILKELTKDADAKTIVINDGIFTYKLKVFVNKHANFVEGIVDESDPVNGVYGSVAMIWGQFKGENKGLKKYGGKTFEEIKVMSRPEDLIVMGGQRDDIPNKVHKKILEFIASEDTKEEKTEKEKKIELARSLYKYRYRYVYKNTQIWDATTLSQFLESYDKAREVLEKSNPRDEEISERISDLERKYKAIKAAPFSDEKYKELARQAEEKIKNKDSYTRSTVAELQRVLSEVKNDYDAGKIKNLLEMNKVEEKLQKALDQLVTKEESKRRFTINGDILQYGNENEKSMANQFMDKNILLIEEANSNIYEITFKKGTFQGITAEVEGLKYNRENGNWQNASLVNTVNDTKTFRLVMPKSEIDKIHIKTLAHMGGPELAEQDAVLKLNLSTKRPEGSQLEEGNKKKLKEFLDSIQELNKDVNDGLYQDPESSQFAERYVEATKLLEANQVTDDAIEAMIRSIKIAKQDLVLKAVKEFTDKLIKAEGITEDKQSKEKYTEKSLAKLQEAVKAGNTIWGTKNYQPKEEIARLINLLDTAMAGLKEKGQEEEEDSTEGNTFTAPVTLMHATNSEQKSMANNAIVSPAKVIYSGDKVKVELTFKGLTIGTSKGHLTNLFYFENNISPKENGKPIAAKIEKKFMDQGADGQDKEFPKVFSFTIDKDLFEKSDFLWCRVWVDVMDGFMGGTPGAGAQEAKIVIDKTNLPKEEPLNKEELTNLINEANKIEKGDKTEESFNKLQGAIKKAQELIDKIKSKEDLKNSKNELQKSIEEFKASPAEVKEAKNKPELKKLLHEQDSLYQEVLKGEYKEEGSKLYLDKYKEAIKLLEDPKTKEDDIDNVIRALKSIKQNRLVAKVLDTFQDLIVKAEEITNNENKDNKYTDASFNKLKEAVAEANKYWLKRYEQTKEKIASLNEMLKEGLAGLKEVEKTDLKKEALKTEIENAKNIEQGKKTEEAFTKLQEAITAAKKVLEEVTDQNQLDQEVEILKAAVKAFNESADKEATPQPQPEPRPNPTPSPENKNNVEKEKIYNLPVKLMHEAQNRESMGNKALVSPARVSIKGNDLNIDLTFKGIEVPMGSIKLYGHLTNLLTFENNSFQASEIPSEVIERYEDQSLKGYRKAFPKTYRIKMTKANFDRLKDDTLNVKVWVDAMDEIVGNGPGSGAQNARLVFDKSQMSEVNPAEEVQPNTPPIPNPSQDDKQSHDNSNKSLILESLRNYSNLGGPQYTYQSNMAYINAYNSLMNLLSKSIVTDAEIKSAIENLKTAASGLVLDSYSGNKNENNNSSWDNNSSWGKSINGNNSPSWGNNSGWGNNKQDNNKNNNGPVTIQYEVPVEVLHAHQNGYSMANSAINHTARVEERNGEFRYSVQFGQIQKDFAGKTLVGNLTNLFILDGGKTRANQFSGNTWSWVMKGKYDRVNVAIWVDAMDSIAGKGPGSGEQTAILSFNWASAKEVGRTGGNNTQNQQKQEDQQNQKKQNQDVNQKENAENSFSDTKGHWAKTAIDYVVSKGYFYGLSKTEFGPNKSITRGQFVSVLGRMLNVNVNDYKDQNFKDVKSGMYYSPYIAWANKVGIVSGIGQGNFAPDKELTREEMAVMMTKFLKVSGKNLKAKGKADGFKDDAKIQGWAKDSVKEMASLGLVSGMGDGNFAPKSPFTRAQVAQVLYNIDHN